MRELDPARGDDRAVVKGDVQVLAGTPFRDRHVEHVLEREAMEERQLHVALPVAAERRDAERAYVAASLGVEVEVYMGLRGIEAGPYWSRSM